MSQGIDYQGFSQAHDRLIAEYRKRQASHALLLYGPSGIMKKEFAAYLAQILLCLSDSDEKPCGHCPACRRCRSGRHGNLLTLGLGNEAKSIKIEQLRALFNALALHPVEPGPRVILITDMHLMTPQAQNALLKSLEEPQSNDFYVLTCNNERAVLPTIISRCRPVQLSTLEDDKIEVLLQRIGGCKEEQAKELSKLSNGRIGFALSVMNDSAYWNTKALADRTFFSIKNPEDIPAASMALKDAKESADLLFDLIEQEARQCLEMRLLSSPKPASPWSDAGIGPLKRMLETLFEARKYKASNVSWQAIADRLLFSITKEIYQCQW